MHAVQCNESVTSLKYSIEMKMMTIWRCRMGTLPFGLFLFASLIVGNTCFAQVDRAGLSGTVTDGSGRRLPGARITALQISTALVRETVSSSNGTYDIPELPIGLYRVTCSAPGFKETVFENLELTVGHTRTLDITLAVGGITQQVNVSGRGSQLDETTDTLGARTEPEQVKELPLNGRNWSTLTALVPGAVDTGGSNQRSIRFAGRGLDDNNFTYDGIDATNIVNQAQQSFVRLAIPTDAIEEFHIDTMLFTAENGSTPGGQIDVASKSGSNTLHGGLFEFLRNDIFDARDPILPDPGSHFVSTSSAANSAAGLSATAASSSSLMKDCAKVTVSRSRASFPARPSPLRWPPPIRRWRRSSPPIPQRG